MDRARASGTDPHGTVESLPDWDDVEGVRILVFDEYRQFYIGQSVNVRKRIKQHWGNRKP